MLNVYRSAFGKLRKVFSKGYEYYLTIYLIANVSWIFIGMVLYSYSKTFLYSDLSVSYVLLFIFNILCSIFLIFFKKVKFDIIDVFLLFLVILGLISVIFAHDSRIALYGVKDRYEGFFQLLYYYSLMFLCTNIHREKYKMIICNFILFFGLINSFICFIQVFDILGFIPIPYRGVSLGQGLIVNSNFLGSYMVLCLGISIGIFLFNNYSKFKNIIYLLICLILYSGLLLSNALSGVVGLFFSLFCLFVYYIILWRKRKFLKTNFIKCIILIICFLFVGILLNVSGGSVINNDVNRFVAETSEISKGNFNDSFGSARMYIFKNTVKVIPKYLLHGIGIDNFYYAFGDEPLFKLSNNNLIFFDKAHNEYLQKLICEGLFSCVTYIAMLFVIFINSVKRIFEDSNYVVIGLLLSFVGYCVQAFFNISVIEVAPIFWIVCGLLYQRKKTYKC